MKKRILSLVTGAIVALASCSQSDEMPGQPQEGEQLATFTIQTPPATRSEVTGLSRYIVEAYEGNDATGEPAERAEETKGTLSLMLKKNTEYTFLFWADKGTAKTGSTASSGYWNTDDLKAVTVTSGKESTTGEAAYCFAKTFNSKDFRTNKVITLRNATAQVNFVETAGMSVVGNTLVVTYSAGATLNVGTGKVTDAAGAITHTFRNVDGFLANTILATDYILAPKGEQRMLDLTLQLNEEAPKPLTNVPFEQCFITNIRGEYSSFSQFTFTITANDEWNTPDNNVPLVQAKVGDYYYKDGTWSTENKATAANPVIGVVYRVFAAGDAMYGKALGKVVSLTEPAALAWTTSGNKATTGATSTTDGKENTDKIFAGVSAGTYSLANYPVFNACQTQRTDTGKDGWYIPITRDYSELFKNVSEINGKIKAISGGVELVAPTGSSDGYWTSMETSQIGANLLNSSTSAASANKEIEHRVRFVLDF